MCLSPACFATEAQGTSRRECPPCLHPGVVPCGRNRCLPPGRDCCEDTCVDATFDCGFTFDCKDPGSNFTNFCDSPGEGNPGSLDHSASTAVGVTTNSTDPMDDVRSYICSNCDRAMESHFFDIGEAHITLPISRCVKIRCASLYM